MSETANRIVKNSFYNFVGNNITKVITIFLTIFIARFFSEIEFGKFSFALSFTGLFIILIDMGTNLVVVRDITTNKEKTTEIVSNVCFLKIISTFWTLSIIFILINILKYPTITKYAVYIASLIIAFESFSETIKSVIQAFEQQKYIAITRIIRVFLRFITTIPFLIMGYKILTILLIYLIVQIVSFLIIFIIYLTKFGSFKIKKIKIRILKKYIIKGFPFLLSSAFVIIYFRIDITMLSIMKNDAIVGWYNAAYTIIDALIAIVIAINSALLPVAVILFNKSKVKLKNLINIYAKLIFTISVPICVGGFVLSDKIILLIFGEKYFESIIVFKFLIWVIIPLYFVHLLGMILIAIKQEKLGVPALFITSIINIIANLILIPKYSLIGAAIATIISEIVYLFMYYAIITRKLYRINILKLMYKPIIASIIMWIVIYFTKSLFVILNIIIGSIIYLGVLILMKNFSNKEIELYKQIKNKILRFK